MWHWLLGRNLSLAARIARLGTKDYGRASVSVCLRGVNGFHLDLTTRWQSSLEPVTINQRITLRGSSISIKRRNFQRSRSSVWQTPSGRNFTAPNPHQRSKQWPRPKRSKVYGRLSHSSLSRCALQMGLSTTSGDVNGFRCRQQRTPGNCFPTSPCKMTLNDFSTGGLTLL
jgi:hypothetical protein